MSLFAYLPLNRFNVPVLTNYFLKLKTLFDVWTDEIKCRQTILTWIFGWSVFEKKEKRIPRIQITSWEIYWQLFCERIVVWFRITFTGLDLGQFILVFVWILSNFLRFFFFVVFVLFFFVFCLFFFTYEHCFCFWLKRLRCKLTHLWNAIKRYVIHSYTNTYTFAHKKIIYIYIHI